MRRQRPGSPLTGWQARARHRLRINAQVFLPARIIEAQTRLARIILDKRGKVSALGMARARDRASDAELMGPSAERH